MPRVPRLSIEQRVAIVRLYFSNGKNAYLTVSLFRREYPNYRTLCSSTVLRVVSKFVEHGTVQDRLKTNCGRKKTVQVPRNVGIIAQKMRQTPTMSIRRLHLGTGLRQSSVQKMLRKTLKMKAYRRPLVQALLPGDIDKRVKWAEYYLEAAERDFTYPDYILWTDEAIFHLDGHVNRHNAVIWSVQNPHAFMECSNQKKAGVMVWAGLIKDHIIGPFFINGSVTGQVYLQLLQQRVWPALQAIMGEEEEFVVFQHDGASAHYETWVRAWLDGKLEDRWMGRGGPIPWPARSPDLSPLDFWLWGYLKNKVYANAVTTLDELRQAIIDEMQAIPATMVHSATLGVVRKAGLLLSIDGLRCS